MLLVKERDCIARNVQIHHSISAIAYILAIRFKFFCLSGLITLLSSISLYGQEYSYVHYDVKDGLAGSTVYDVTQDKDGFLWFATEAGISRFDGTHFKNFTTEDGLPSAEILVV